MACGRKRRTGPTLQYVYRKCLSGISGYIPQKFGLYQWNVNSWGSSITRTLYTKGLHVFRDQSGSPALSVNTMLEYIRAI